MGVIVGLLAGAGVLLIWLSVTSPYRPSRSHETRLRRLLIDAGFAKVSPALFIAMCSILALVAAATVIATTTGLVVALYAAIGIGLAPVVWMRSRARRSREAISGVWPEVIESLIAGIRSGLPLSEAVAALAHSGPPAARAGFEEFASTLHVTGRMDDALDALKERFADPVADRVAEALRVAKDVGGHDIGTMLRALVVTLRNEQRTRGELLARQSWTVNGARLAAAAPWFVLLMLCTRPENARAFDSAAGGAILALGAVLTIVAHQAMTMIGRLPTEARSLL
ncbi:tight adherence protein B [Bowdeniella nasicola]|uniref:Tight adherence protein B n=2 Tax=Bacteria TaxID=2 RepID=A0A1H3Z3U7_9ACTO|nr:type II secretion system F family protein [Bowdeniella nasicola]SEA18064.1 tight adherence protein B [Bowdeniella nasicola]